MTCTKEAQHWLGSSATLKFNVHVDLYCRKDTLKQFFKVDIDAHFLPVSTINCKYLSN